MPPITLINTTENTAIDWLLCRIIAHYESTFTRRIAGYYLIGSYTDASALQTSDVDLYIVFKQPSQTRDELEAVQQLNQRLEDTARKHAIEIDISLLSEGDLQTQGITPTLKLGGCLLFGEDICGRYPLVTIQQWAHERMHAVYYLLTTIYRRHARLRLAYPNENDEFYGYMNRSIQLSDGREALSTRNLVRTTGWAATALLAFKSGQYVTRKSDCHILYRQYIGDEWSRLIEDVYTLCRQRWNYLVPKNPNERKQLSTLCEQVLLFERHFLHTYKAFLLRELYEGPEAYRQDALTFQKRLPFEDNEVEDALRISAP
ncbi:nucleotidyltransferase domain-containing protein [Ktedonospora formicarum]|uniref:Polymerase beta nucleotidyltransferase domain-containing protein n=1 Tax=Ktedonospora formicarum TaxID=2778364 RepID=A0A8J3HVF7_9CHLR|nr:nucleotidyltransferase domain-containing protein [Ktedonospora formicarum]GHO42706.1 hypothetical protein KSX_08690 [Ktedonospora formicarum]